MCAAKWEGLGLITYNQISNQKYAVKSRARSKNIMGDSLDVKLSYSLLPKYAQLQNKKSNYSFVCLL